MIEHTDEIKELVKALASVQSSVHGVGKDSVNPHFKNRYASLEAVITAAREPMQHSGLTFTQAPGAVINGAVEITTMLMHESGQWMRSTLHVPLAKTDPQGVGSAITYGCRYSLMAMLGLPPLDDDAEAAVSRTPPAKPIAVPRNNTPPSSETANYVTEARATIAKFTTTKALLNWWANEKVNRDKYHMVAESGPGLDLMNAYLDRKAQLQADLQMAG